MKRGIKNIYIGTTGTSTIVVHVRAVHRLVSGGGKAKNCSMLGNPYVLVCNGVPECVLLYYKFFNFFYLLGSGLPVVYYM
jgi:hypothetical protein